MVQPRIIPVFQISSSKSVCISSDNHITHTSISGIPHDKENKDFLKYDFVFFKHSLKCTNKIVCETQMPPIIADSKYGQGQEEKNIYTSTIIFSQDTCHVQYERSNFYYFVMNMKKVSYQQRNQG